MAGDRVTTPWVGEGELMRLQERNEQGLYATKACALLGARP